MHMCVYSRDHRRTGMSYSITVDLKTVSVTKPAARLVASKCP